MKIKYNTIKSELVAFYIRQWKAYLWKIHLAVFVGISLFVYILKTSRGADSTEAIIPSLISGLIPIGLMFLFPIIMHKPQPRLLEVNEEGIETIIGKKSGKIEWSKIASYENSDGVIYIVGSNMNGFMIPERAFETTASRDEFVTFLQNHIK